MEIRRCTNTFLVRLDPGEEIVASLKKVAQEHHIALATVTGIGAVNQAVVGLFEPESKTYLQNKLAGSLEVVALNGNISLLNEETYLHLHIMLADKKAQVYGGHLDFAIVSATAEIFLTIVEGKVNRKFEEKIGLNIIEFSQ